MPTQRWSNAAIGGAVAAVLAMTGCSSASSKTATPAPSPSARPSTPAAAVTPAAPGAPIPAKYRQLYDRLGTNLDAYQAAITAMPTTSANKPATVAAAELLPANGNRLTALLAPATMTSVNAWLSRFQAMGIRGVTLGIKVPMLLPTFSPDAAAYTAFYSTVVTQAHKLGMTVDVELGALFCGTAYATCTLPFHGSYETFVADTITQANTVISRIKPDMLDVLSEPTTEASLTGVEAFKNPAGVGGYVHDVLAGIGSRGATKVGAGAATWLAPAYNQAILKNNVDFLVMHIYPLNPNIASTIVADTALAETAHKPIVADEVGLYKTDSTAQSGAATSNTIYRRDSFSFFQPLDIRFLTITGEWAKKAGVHYLSPFWASQFFAYLTWSPTIDALSFPALTQQSNLAVAQAFKAGQLSDYGRRWPAILG